MGYLAKLTVGLALFAAAVTAADYAIYHLIQTGTCASGGPYLSARPCPKGTGTLIVSLTIAVFAGLAGLALFAARGEPPRGDDETGSDGPTGRRLSAGILGWSAMFISIGVTSLAAVLGHHTVGPGSKTAGIIIGALFIPMGAVPLIGAVWGLARRQSPASAAATPASYTTAFDERLARIQSAAKARSGGLDTPGRAAVATPPPPSPAPAPAPTPPAAVAQEQTSIDHLNELARLHDSGVLSSEEFERAKAKVLSDMTKGK